MARRLENYERKKRTRKRTILIGAEGIKNKTESLYFNSFNKNSNNYRIRMANGNSTDPEKMVKDMINYLHNQDINLNEDENKAYCVLDTDNSDVKTTQLKDAKKLAEENGIILITSTPSFEDWFLCHFTYTTKSFTNKGIIKELNKHISYEKNKDISSTIIDKTDVAIMNAKKQCEYQEELGNSFLDCQANPSTEVYKIIEELEKKEN